MKTHSQYLHLKDNFNNLKRVWFGDCLLFTLLSKKFMTSWVSNSHSEKDHLKVLELILATLGYCVWILKHSFNLGVLRLNFKTFFQPTSFSCFTFGCEPKAKVCNIKCEYNKTPKQVGDKPLHKQPSGQKIIT